MPLYSIAVREPTLGLVQAACHQSSLYGNERHHQRVLGPGAAKKTRCSLKNPHEKTRTECPISSTPPSSEGLAGCLGPTGPGGDKTRCVDLRFRSCSRIVKNSACDSDPRLGLRTSVLNGCIRCCANPSPVRALHSKAALQHTENNHASPAPARSRGGSARLGRTGPQEPAPRAPERRGRLITGREAGHPVAGRGRRAAREQGQHAGQRQKDVRAARSAPPRGGVPGTGQGGARPRGGRGQGRPRVKGHAHGRRRQERLVAQPAARRRGERTRTYY